MYKCDGKIKCLHRKFGDPNKLCRFDIKRKLNRKFKYFVCGSGISKSRDIVGEYLEKKLFFVHFIDNISMTNIVQVEI